MLLFASVGPNVDDARIKKIILSGADVLRFNFSYYSIADNIQHLNRIQKLVEELHSSAEIMIDLPLNKIRLGDFENKIFPIKENDIITMRSASFSPDCNQFIPVNTPKLGDKVQLNQTMSLGDGQILLQVEDIIDVETIKVRILNNGVIRYLKTINIPNRITDEEMLSQYRSILQDVKTLEPKYIAVSYISRGFWTRVKSLLQDKNLKNGYHVIIKIEKEVPENELTGAFNDELCDVVLLDRGELGVNVPFQKIGIIQEEVIKLAKQSRKKIIISTQILESTMNSFIPGRSDILDLTHIVLSGADGIMFCNETGFGSRPSYTISVAKKIIEETTRYLNNK